jgi:hypothetical protein
MGNSPFREMIFHFYAFLQEAISCAYEMGTGGLFESFMNSGKSGGWGFRFFASRLVFLGRWPHLLPDRLV